MLLRDIGLSSSASNLPVSEDMFFHLVKENNFCGCCITVDPTCRNLELLCSELLKQKGPDKFKRHIT